MIGSGNHPPYLLGNATAVIRKKKKKPTKLELKAKAVEGIPIRDRWWSVWACEPSNTVASIVSEFPGHGGYTEEVWSRINFEKEIKRWMAVNKDEKFLNPYIFSR